MDKIANYRCILRRLVNEYAYYRPSHGQTANAPSAKNRRNGWASSSVCRPCCLFDPGVIAKLQPRNKISIEIKVLSEPARFAKVECPVSAFFRPKSGRIPGMPLPNLYFSRKRLTLSMRSQAREAPGAPSRSYSMQPYENSRNADGGYRTQQDIGFQVKCLGRSCDMFLGV